MWDDLKGFFDFVFDLSDKSLLNIRLHTSLMTGDPWFAYMAHAWITADEKKLGIPMIKQYHDLTQEIPDRYWASEPVTTRQTESVGLRYRGRLVSDDVALNFKFGSVSYPDDEVISQGRRHCPLNQRCPTPVWRLDLNRVPACADSPANAAELCAIAILEFDNRALSEFFTVDFEDPGAEVILNEDVVFAGNEVSDPASVVF